MLEYTPVALVEGRIRFLEAMATMIKMPRPTQTGELSVHYNYRAQ